jgi:hypothetical protein
MQSHLKTLIHAGVDATERVPFGLCKCSAEQDFDAVMVLTWSLARIRLNPKFKLAYVTRRVGAWLEVLGVSEQSRNAAKYKILRFEIFTRLGLTHTCHNLPLDACPNHLENAGMCFHSQRAKVLDIWKSEQSLMEQVDEFMSSCDEELAHSTSNEQFETLWDHTPCWKRLFSYKSRLSRYFRESL